MLSLLLTVLAPPTPADQAFTDFLADGDHDAQYDSADSEEAPRFLSFPENPSEPTC